MKREYETVIIGAGGHGLSVAYNLAKNGRKNIAVFEKDYVGCGATGRCTQLIRYSYSTPEWIRFFRECVSLFHDITDWLDINTLYTQPGYILIAKSEEKSTLLKSMISLHKKFGLNTELLSPAELLKIVPQVSIEGTKLALIDRDGGFARHDAVIWGFEKQAKKLGVEFYPFTKVNGIRTSMNKITSVITDLGEVSCNTVVNCAGSFSKDVCAMTGVDLPTESHRLEAFVTEPLKPFLKSILVSLDQDTYLYQSQRGEIIGGTEVDVRQSKTTKSSFEFLEKVCPRYLSIVPGLKYANILRQWAGSLDVTPDFSPLIGRTSTWPQGLWVDCGWGGYGYMACTGAGKYLAEYIMSGKQPSLIEPFSPERFAMGRAIRDEALAAVVRN